eukprot:392184-Prymnesium_polylepis.1
MAFLKLLILPELGESDLNFIYTAKRTVAMAALSLDEDHATINKFENCARRLSRAVGGDVNRVRGGVVRSPRRLFTTLSAT